MQQQQQRNLLIFFLLMSLLVLGVPQLQRLIWPPAPQPKKEPPAELAKPREPKKDEATLAKAPEQPPVTGADALIPLGAQEKDSPFHLYLLLDPLGGGVRMVILNKFQEADDYGRPTDRHLALVPADANRHVPAYLLYHFDADDSKFDHPLDTLGRVKWQVVKHDGKEVAIDQVDGKERQTVSFQTELQGVKITKTYSLTAGEYHVGLRVDLERAAAPAGAKSGDASAVKFRYQLAGPRGQPVEGKWYTPTFRNALIGTLDDRGNLYRDLQELRQISSWAAGNPVDPKDGQWLRYAGVAVQYFASVIVVDENQDDQKFLRRAQSTLERVVVRGKIKGDQPARPDHIILVSDDKTQTTVFLPDELRGELSGVKDNTVVAAVYRPLIYDPQAKEPYRLAEEVGVGSKADTLHAVWEDDITMRVTTDAVELKPGKKISHQYLLYHGPVKPSLLGHLTGDKAVAPDVVERYAHTLHLNTMTDYQSPGKMGTFSRAIGWTWLIIMFTNLMHAILSVLHSVVSSYGLCIIFLTVMVRGLMYPLSRKQAMMGMKMQALAPELKKLQQKYKDDKQALGAAQWDLYRKNGVNPFGSCWVLLLQMPVFMGLYYALQESIQFRLASFWPTWIKNLAAPDMTVWWGESIPWISRPEDYGSSLIYLGPYLNVLPIIAVTFMIFQQKLMMPPPADEQQEMQQKMMKWMMLVFGLMFYKVAAGLCIYFIATTLWGFAERKLLPKIKPAGASDDATRPALASAGGSDQVATADRTTGATPNGASAKRAARNKRKAERARVGATREEEPASGLGRLMKRLGDWWTDVLEQAKKK